MTEKHTINTDHFNMTEKHIINKDYFNIHDINNKGNNKITELRAILQRESQNS